MARGSLEIFDQVFERVDADGAGGGELGGGVFAEVEADNLVACETETLRHVEAHLAESDDSEFHGCEFLSVSLCGLDAEIAEIASELRRRSEDDGLHPESAGGRAVLGFVVDEEGRRGVVAGDFDGVAVDAGGRLHLVEVAGAEEIAEVAAEIEGVEAMGVEFPATRC